MQVEPDILTMGKGIAGGFPFAAFAVNGWVDGQIHRGDHGGTYCGNPLGCAVAVAVVNYLLQHQIASRAAVLGGLLLQGLVKLARQYPAVIESMRGKGLLCALQLRSDEAVDELTQRCLESGLLITPTRNQVVRLIPSLLLTENELNAALHLLDLALSALVRNR